MNCSTVGSFPYFQTRKWEHDYVIGSSSAEFRSWEPRELGWSFNGLGGKRRRTPPGLIKALCSSAAPVDPETNCLAPCHSSGELSV
jgi:hypothetical protein